MVTTVRPAREQEAQALHEIAAITFPLACPAHLSAEAIGDFIAEHLSVDAFRAHLANPDHAVLVAVVDDRLLGYALVKLGPPEDPDVRAAVPDGPWCELSKLYVHPDGRGQRLGSGLLARAIDCARQRGCDSAQRFLHGVGLRRGRRHACRFLPRRIKRFDQRSGGKFPHQRHAGDRNKTARHQYTISSSRPSWSVI